MPRKYKTINICCVNTRRLPGRVGEFCLIKGDITINLSQSKSHTVTGIYPRNPDKQYHIKGTVSVILSDPLCKDGNVRFTTVPLFDQLC